MGSLARVDISENVGYLYFVLEYTGVALAALVGGTVAKRMNFDVVGFAFIALISSLSGGLIRDALLNDGPAMALENPGYLITATIAAAVAFFVDFRGTVWDNFRFYADVVTIGVWAVGGTLRALENDLSWPAAIVLAVITAIGGTLVRDVVLRRVPGLFTEQKMYVLPAILASAMMLTLNNFGMVWQGMLASAVAAPVASMLVYWRSAKPTEQERHPEKRLEEKLGEVLGVRADGVEEALQNTSDAELVGAVRGLLTYEVRHRAEAKS